MNNLQFNIFDFFGNIIPGLIILLCCNLVFTKSQFTLESVLESSSSIDLTNAIALLLLAYLVGFSSQYISYRVFKRIINRFVKEKISKNNLPSIRVY